ncbi:41907_t:CDS:2, partial [Gigaspora margarita]
SSSEKLVENLADHAINPGYKYVMHLFEHYPILQEYDSRIEKAFILCIVTSLISRVHEKIREAGALPLGLLITSDELEMTIKNAINLLKLILSEHAFFGCGCDIGPQHVLTDDSASESNALKLYWPQSNLLL